MADSDVMDGANEKLNSSKTTNRLRIDISLDPDGQALKEEAFHYDSVDTPKVDSPAAEASTKFPGLTPFNVITSNVDMRQTTANDCTDFGGNDLTDSAPNSAVTPENEDGLFASKRQHSQKQPQQQASREIPDIVQPSSTSIDDTFSYNVTSTPRGYFLLVNNKDFLPSSTMESYPRNGTDVDSNAMAQLFQELGFLVDEQRNLRCKEIMAAVKSLVSLDYSNVSCVGCCFLSHGKEGILYGTDGEIEIKDIAVCFQKNRSLVGKPKLFFFQACQGSEYMDSVQPLCQVDGPGDGLYGNSISLPTEADFLYAYSTVPGYYSWRNSQKGSWFVQAIVEVFRANAHKMDVLRMLTRVNNNVCMQKSNTGAFYSNNKRQVCSIVTQLRYELFLYPPNGPLQTIKY